MECSYCGLIAKSYVVAENKEGMRKCFCDESCFKARKRESMLPDIQRSIRYTEECLRECSVDNEYDKLIDKVMKLWLMFCKGVLKRQTVEQLNLLLKRFVDVSRDLFSYAEEHPESVLNENLLLCIGEMAKGESKMARQFIKYYGK